MKTMMTTEVFRATEVFVVSTLAEVVPDLVDRDVTGGCAVRSAGTLKRRDIGDPVDGAAAATGDERAASDVEAKNFMGVVRLSGLSDADQTRRRADNLAGVERAGHGTRVS